MTLSSQSSAVVSIIRTVGRNDKADYQSLSEAFADITDASAEKRYSLHVDAGTYTEINCETKDFIDVIGVSPELVHFAGALPNDATAMEIMHRQPLICNSTSRVENISVSARNMRYALHSDSMGQIKDGTLEIINCHVQHAGNDEAPNNTWIAMNALGAGSSSGQTIIATDTTFKAPCLAVSVHNREYFTQPSQIKLSRCSLTATGKDFDVGGMRFRLASALGLQSLGSRQRDRCYLDDCEIVGDVVIENAHPWIPTDIHDQPADHTEWRLSGRGNTPFVFRLREPGRALKIETGPNDRIEVWGSAVSRIFGDIKSYPGSGGIAGYLHGSCDIAERGVGENGATFIIALGRRLGNCQLAPLELFVSLNGEPPTYIGFKRDYTLMSNTQILRFINGHLDGRAAASEYMCARYRPSILDEEELRVNRTSEGILMGMAVAYDAARDSIRKMTQSDTIEAFAGFAWEDIYPGRSGRVKVFGYLAVEDVLTEPKSGLRMGETFSVGNTPGVLSKNGDKVLVTAISPDAFRIERERAPSGLGRNLRHNEQDSAQTGSHLSLSELGSIRSQEARRFMYPSPDMIAHFSDIGNWSGKIGDWVGDPRGSSALEGLVIAPMHAPARHLYPSIEYKFVYSQSLETPWEWQGQTCGSHGLSLPCLGIAFRLRGGARAGFRCSYDVAFTDGTLVENVAAGTVATREGGVTVAAFRLKIAEIAPEDASEQVYGSEPFVSVSPESYGDRTVRLRLLSPSFEAQAPHLRNAELVPDSEWGAMSQSWDRPKFPEEIVALRIVDNAVIVSEGIVFDDDLNLVRGTDRLFTEDHIAERRLKVLEAKFSSPPRVSGLCVLCKSRGSGNFGHYLIEMLPKAIIAKQLFPHHPLKFVVHDTDVLHVVKESLSLLGVDPADIVVTGDDPVLFDNLIVLDGLTRHGGYQSSLCLQSLTALAKDIPPAPNSKIFVIRHGKPRALSNQAQVATLLQERGFSVVDPASMTWAEQIALFKGATTVVGVLGAAMTNMAFCPAGARTILLTSACFPDTFFWFIAQHAQLYYTEIRCPDLPEAASMNPRWNAGFLAESDDLEFLKSL